MRSLLPLLLALFVSADLAAAGEEDRLAEARSLVELGTMYVEVGSDTDNPEKVRKGVAKYREARTLYKDALAEPDITPAEKNRIKAFLVDVESRIDWYSSSKVDGAGGVATGEVRIPELKAGERIGPWCRRVRKLYDETDDPAGQAALARGLASKGGVLAVPTLFDLFEKEEYPKAREGVHEALAMVGTYRVARKMGTYARKSAEKHWENALEVIYLCLEKSERSEPEKPYLKSIRDFHRMKNRKLTLQILKRLDSMEPAGTAALGEVVYVEDFGYHDYTIELLSHKRGPARRTPARVQDEPLQVRVPRADPGPQGPDQDGLVRGAGAGRAPEQQGGRHLDLLDAAKDHRRDHGHGQAQVARLVEGREGAPPGAFRRPRRAARRRQGPGDHRRRSQVAGTPSAAPDDEAARKSRYAPRRDRPRTDDPRRSASAFPPCARCSSASWSASWQAETASS